MRTHSMTSRSILALTLCGLLLAISCIDESSPAAARGFGGMRGGGARGFGGMRGGVTQHQTTRSTGRTNQYTTGGGRNASTNRNVSNSGSNKTGNYSTNKTTNTSGTVNNSSLSATGANTGSKATNTTGATNSSTYNATGTKATNTSNTTTNSSTTNTQGAVGTATGNTSTGTTGSKTTTTTGNTTTSNTTTGSTTTNTQGPVGTATGSTSTGNTGSKTGRTPGTPGNAATNTPVANTGSGTANGPGTIANTGTDTPRGGGRIPGSQTPSFPSTIGGGGGAGGGAGAVSGGGAAGAAAAASSGVPPQGEQRFVPNEIVLGFSSSATPQEIDEIAQRYGVTRLGSQSFPLIDLTLYRWQIASGSTVANTIGTIENERLVASAQPNYLFTLQEDATKISSNTGGDAAQYVLGKLQIEQAHQVATGKNIAIAVIDSEIDAKHPDLAGAIEKHFDALGGDETPQSHGTAMAGAIAAHGKLSGITLGPHLLAARAFDNSAGGAKATSFAIYKSLQWAADNGARVINMSFAGPADPTLHRMLTAAYDKGIVLVAAAGNAGPKSAPLYPAADPDVIAVTATDSQDDVFEMANRGSYIAIAAPGVDILALAPGDSYQITTGTSVAAAHVSGIAAMLLEEKPSLTPAEVRSIIISTARRLGPAGEQADFGAGLADAYHAVTSLNGKISGKSGTEQAKE